MNEILVNIKLIAKQIITNSDTLSAIRRKYRYIKSKFEFGEMQRAYNATDFPDTIRTLKGIHEGERCFVIGNGPSLKAEDLGKIKGEYSFAANRIYLMYEKTEWRPTYFMCQDHQLIRSIVDYYKTCREKVIIGYHALYNYKIDVPGAYYYLDDSRDSNRIAQQIEFSDQADKVLYDGGSVSYAALQMAVYMGFKKIYLLGMDHDFSRTLDKNRRIIKHDNVKEDYFDKRYIEAYKQFEKKGKIFAVPDKQLMDLAFEATKKYCDAHNIKVYNVTRGGKLEVFERVDFDKIVEDYNCENSSYCSNEIE